MEKDTDSSPPKRKKTWLTKILGGPEGQSAATTSPSEQVAQEMDRYLHHPIIDVESFPLEYRKISFTTWQAGSPLFVYLCN